jgi:hypothetical protein
VRHRAAWLGPLRLIGHRCDFFPGGLIEMQLSPGKIRQARAQHVAAPSASEFAWVSRIVGHLSADDFAWLSATLPAGFVRQFTFGNCQRGWDVGGVDDPAEVVRSLAACRWLPGLRSLRLSVHGLGAGPHAAALAGMAGLASLRELALSGCGLDDVGVAALAGSPNFARLTHFAVQSCAERRLWPQLAAARWNGSLESLTVESCAVGAAGLRPLLAPGILPRLRALSVGHNFLDASAARDLATWPALAELRELRLDGNPIGDGGAEQLQRSPFLTGLRVLHLQACGLTQRGVLALVNATMPLLEVLDLGTNDGTNEAALTALCQAPHFPNLHTVTHSNHRLRSSVSRALRTRFPGRGGAP